MRTTTHSARRKRGWYLLAIIAVIGAGLASRKFAGILPAAFGKYPGDVLWALMVYLGWGLLTPKASHSQVAASAALTCIGIEALKLYQAPWIVGIRHSTIGHLIFGHVFSWQNLAAYAAGVTIGVILEWSFASHRHASALS